MKSSKQSNFAATGGMKWVRRTVVGLIGRGFVLLAFAGVIALAIAHPATTFAQSVITPEELRAACETSPQNTVFFPAGAKIAPAVHTDESVTTGCTVILGADRAFEMVRTRLRFAGLLRILGDEKSKVTLTEESLLEAPSAILDLGGFATELKIDQSFVRATTGDLDVRMGAGAKLEITSASQFGTSPSERHSVEASGLLRIVGGQKLTAELEDTWILGEAGLSLDLGAESVLKTNRVNISGGEPAGVAIRSASPKVLLELTSTTVGAFGREPREYVADLIVDLDGAESSIKGSSAEFGGSGTTKLSVSETTSGGLIELNGNAPLHIEPDSSVIGRRVVVEASRASEKGVLKVGFTLGTALPNAPDSELIYRTGALGTTEVVSSSLNASVAIRILTGPQGTCKQELNRIEGNGSQAPVLQLCTP